MISLSYRALFKHNITNIFSNHKIYIFYINTINVNINKKNTTYNLILINYINVYIHDYII